MPQCGPSLRGYKYNTPLSLRCLANSPCPCCKLCQSFSKHNARCVMCESRKLDPRYRTCNCPPAQKEIFQQLELMFRAPLFDLEGLDPDKLTVGHNIAEDPERIKLSKRIQEEFLGVGVNTAEHTIADTSETVRDALRG